MTVHLDIYVVTMKDYKVDLVSGIQKGFVELSSGWDSELYCRRIKLSQLIQFIKCNVLATLKFGVFFKYVWLTEIRVIYTHR